MKSAVRRIVFLATALCLLPAMHVLAQSDSVTITSPKEGDSIVNTNAQFTGTAPPSTIVTVVITDTDTNRSNIAHQEGGKVEGTVTTGADGGWTYVPQHTLVPGQFSVQASYINDQNEVVDSNKVGFIVLNESGSSTQLSRSFIRRLIVFIGLLVVLIVAIVLFITGRRRKKDLRRIDDNAEEIEKDLQETAEQLASTNAQIAELNKRLEEERRAEQNKK